jgi:hypothetical protein
MQCDIGNHLQSGNQTGVVGCATATRRAISRPRHAAARESGRGEPQGAGDGERPLSPA